MSATFKNFMLAAAIAMVLSCSYLLDGPTELDAIEATAASIQDAQQAAQMVAAQAHTVTAQVQP